MSESKKENIKVDETEKGIKVSVTSKGKSSQNPRKRTGTTKTKKEKVVNINDAQSEDISNLSAAIIDEDGKIKEEVPLQDLLNKEDTKKIEEKNPVPRPSESEIITPISAGDPTCYLYFYLQRDINNQERMNDRIISISIVDYKGQSFYAELSDFDVRKVSVYTFQNIIKNLLFYSNKRHKDTIDKLIDENHYYCYGDIIRVRDSYLNWISNNPNIDKNKPIQYVGDYDIFENALFLDYFGYIPNYKVSSTVISINQDIASSLQHKLQPGETIETYFNGYVPSIEAIELDRLSLCKNTNDKDFLQYVKDTNSLGGFCSGLISAYIRKAIFQNIWGMKIE